MTFSAAGDLLERLVAIPSVTGSEEALVGAVFDRLTAGGWECVSIPVSPGRRNLLARRGVPAVVLTDPTRLRQILANLLSNAVKFTPAGSIELAVEPEAGETAAPGSSLRVQFHVRDSGIGISAEGISHLFNAYSQTDLSVARRFGGTGLGLAIAQRLAEIFGGGITVESIPGQGTTFTATIVVVVGPPAA